MTWKLLLSVLVLISAVASLPLDPDSESYKLSTHANTENKENDRSSSSGDQEDIKTKTSHVDKEEDKKKITSSTEKDEGSANGGDIQQPKYCVQPYSFTIVTLVHEIVNGERRSYYKPRVINTKKCCEGYKLVGTKCRLDLCKNQTCQADQQSKCVTLERCGSLIPVFVTTAGIISDVCMQPEEAREHFNMCPNDTSICKYGSRCAGHHNRDAVCFSSKCDCSPGPVWLLPSGKDALCLN